jgi:hypothetical protein
MRRRRLQDDGRAVALALELTDSALAKVDPTDTARNARMPVGYRAPTSVARITTFSFSCAWFPVKDQPAHCVLTGIRSDRADRPRTSTPSSQRTCTPIPARHLLPESHKAEVGGQYVSIKRAALEIRTELIKSRSKWLASVVVNDSGVLAGGDEPCLFVTGPDVGR